MTIYAYTEPNCTLPGYVNLHERDPGIFVLTVRASGSQDSQSMHLTREQVLNLVNDASVYLDGDYDQLNKNEAIRAARDYEAEARRAQVLDMALRTPGLSDHHDVLEAAAAYQAHITGQQPVSAAPDVKRMVNRFLGWPLPKTFYPDCGISFDGREPDAMNPHKSWPTGTNLLNAEEARAMFEHVLRDE